MAQFSVLIFALALVFSSADGWTKDKNGRFTAYGKQSCGALVSNQYCANAYRQQRRAPQAISAPTDWLSVTWVLANSFKFPGQWSGSIPRASLKSTGP